MGTQGEGSIYGWGSPQQAHLALHLHLGLLNLQNCEKYMFFCLSHRVYVITPFKLDTYL